MPRQWIGYPEMSRPGVLPPDLTPRRWPWCDATHSAGYVCTRLKGHTGRHAAGNGVNIVAVWHG